MFSPDARVFGVLREYFQHYGYWTIAIMLLLESAGLPAPGEATLLLATCLASSQGQVRLAMIIAVAVAASVLGDNAGYAVGYFGGRPFVDRYLRILHVSDKTIQKGERFFAEHGAWSIFWARFIDGVRIIAGPLAGTLHMPWRKFLLFNFLGAAVWVTTIVTIGSLFGGHLDHALRLIGNVNLIALLVIVFWWWKRHRSHLSQQPAGTLPVEYHSDLCTASSRRAQGKVCVPISGNLMRCFRGCTGASDSGQHGRQKTDRCRICD
ncbi:MAG: DedA family protein [Acidobacteriaceae bacterium]|nr:DedA family protein [Acidobacteriaceae bacterium]